MRLLRVSTFLLLCVVAAPQTAFALSEPRGGSLPLSLLEASPAKLVDSAFQQAYGRALTTEFAAVMYDSANPECLRSKSITKEKMADRTRAILLRRGAYIWKRLIGTIDRSKYKKFAPARIGRTGLADIKSLEGDPKVKAYLETERPALLAYAASYVTVQLERYFMLNRVKFVRGISPYSSDNKTFEELDLGEKTATALKALVASDTSGVLERYLGITAAAQIAMNDAVDKKKAEGLGPGELLADPNSDREGLYKEMVGLCVVTP